MSKETIRALMLVYAEELCRKHGIGSQSQDYIKLVWQINEVCNLAADL